MLLQHEQEYPQKEAAENCGYPVIGTAFSFTQAQLQFFKDPRINQDILKKALDERSGRPVLLNPPEF